MLWEDGCRTYPHTKMMSVFVSPALTWKGVSQCTAEMAEWAKHVGDAGRYIPAQYNEGFSNLFGGNGLFVTETFKQRLESSSGGVGEKWG